MVDSARCMILNEFLRVSTLFPSVSDITVTVFDIFFRVFKILGSQIFQPKVRKVVVETPKKPSRR